MNIFYLDKDPVECAKAHHDDHVTKMCLEAAQILSNTQRVFVSNRQANELKLYITTNTNNPFVQWTMQSPAAYTLIAELFVALLDEYAYRFGKPHTCEHLREAFGEPPTKLMTHSKRMRTSYIHPGRSAVAVVKKDKATNVPLVMPKRYFITHGMQTNPKPNEVSPLHSHRYFYVNAHLNQEHTYTKRTAPTWLKGYTPPTEHNGTMEAPRTVRATPRPRNGYRTTETVNIAPPRYYPQPTRA